MAHFANIDENNVVTRVIVVSNEDCGNYEFPESDIEGQNFIKNVLKLDGRWLQTSYNMSGGIHWDYETKEPSGKQGFRKNYAGIGFIYDENLDAFIPQKPFNSWILNIENGFWYCPVLYPMDGQKYGWDENTLSWVIINQE